MTLIASYTYTHILSIISILSIIQVLLGKSRGRSPKYSRKKTFIVQCTERRSANSTVGKSPKKICINFLPSLFYGNLQIAPLSYVHTVYGGVVYSAHYIAPYYISVHRLFSTLIELLHSAKGKFCYAVSIDEKEEQQNYIEEHFS